MRVLAIDPGSRRVGLAVSDPTGTIAQPLRTLAAEPRESLPARLAAVAAEVGAGRLVVGLPRQLDGGLGPAAKAARALAAELRRTAGLRVEMWDERLTSVAADRSLLEGGMKRARRRQLVDQVAATMLLQTYLEADARARQTPTGS